MENFNKKNNFKVVAIYGSPRSNGCTDTLMNLFLEGIDDYEKSMEITESKRKISRRKIKIEKIYCNKLNIIACRGCRSCSKTGECIINDEMQDIYIKLIEADFIAVATPIFFTSISGYLKPLIDRCQRFWSLKYEHEKNIFGRTGKGIMISSAGSGSKTMFDCAERIIKAFFDVIYIDYINKFVFNYMESRNDILKSDAREIIYNYGKNLKKVINEI